MHIFYLSPAILDGVVKYLDTEDIKSLILTCRPLCYNLRHNLWSHVHVKTISSKSNHTNTDLQPFQGHDHNLVCPQKPSSSPSNLFMFEHSCRPRYIRIDEHNLAEICIGMLNGGYEDAFSRIQTLTFDLPLLFPEATSVPNTAREMVRVDFGSLVHWFVHSLDPDLFIDLHRLEVTAVELMVELETPLVSTLLKKFQPMGVETALFAVTQANWAQRIPAPTQALIAADNSVRVLSIECETLEDAWALTEHKPLPASVERFDLHVGNGIIEANQLQKLLPSRLSELKINGDVFNPTGIAWVPPGLTRLQVGECKPKLLPVGPAAFTPSITSLHIDMKSGSILEQFHLPHLQNLWVTLCFSEFYSHHFETLSTLLKSSSRIKQMRLQGVPYDQVCRLLSVAGCGDTLDSLALEYAGFTRGNQQFTNRLTRKGAMRVVRECPNIRNLVIDLLLPKPHRVTQVLREFVQFCPRLRQVLCCVRDRDTPWFSEWDQPTIAWGDGSGRIDLGTNKLWSRLDIPTFSDKVLLDEPEESKIAEDSNVVAALMYLSVNNSC